jgi:hypothetical protein
MKPSSSRELGNLSSKFTRFSLPVTTLRILLGAEHYDEPEKVWPILPVGE